MTALNDAVKAIALLFNERPEAVGKLIEKWYAEVPMKEIREARGETRDKLEHSHSIYSLCADELERLTYPAPENRIRLVLEELVPAVRGEDAWVDELFNSGGHKDRLRTVLRASHANIKQQIVADLDRQNQAVRGVLSDFRKEGKELVNLSETLANNGEAHRSDISLVRGRGLEGCAARVEAALQREAPAAARVEYTKDGPEVWIRTVKVACPLHDSSAKRLALEINKALGEPDERKP